MAGYGKTGAVVAVAASLAAGAAFAQAIQRQDVLGNWTCG